MIGSIKEYVSYFLIIIEHTTSVYNENMFALMHFAMASLKHMT